MLVSLLASTIRTEYFMMLVVHLMQLIYKKLFNSLERQGQKLMWLFLCIICVF